MQSKIVLLIVVLLSASLLSAGEEGAGEVSDQDNYDDIEAFDVEDEDASVEEEEEQKNGSEKTNEKKNSADSEPIEEELGEVVVTASKTEKSRLDTTLAVEVVSKEDIAEKMPSSAAEAVKNIPGVSLSSPSGNYFLNPNIRGLGGRRVIMAVDGRRIDTEKTVGVTGYFLEVSDIERIEVMKGPGSVLYGSEALGGVINFITKDPLKQNGFGAIYRFGYGSNNKEITNFLSAGYGTGNMALNIAGKMRTAENFKTGAGETIDNSFYDDRNLSLNFAWKPFENHTFRLKGSYFNGGEIGKAANVLDDEKKRRIAFPSDLHYMIDSSYEIEKLGKWKKLHLSFYSDITDRHQKIRFLDSLEGDGEVLAFREKFGNFKNFGWSVFGTLQPFDFTLVTMGLDGRYKSLNMEDQMTTLLMSKEYPQISKYPFDNSSQFDTGIYVEVEQLISDRLSLTAGQRFDIVSLNHREIGLDASGKERIKLPDQDSDTLVYSGNVGLLYTVSDHLNVTLNLGRAFRVPTLKEKFATIDSCKGRMEGTPELQPEKSFNLDLGLKGKYSSLGYELYGFVTYIDNLIAPQLIREGHYKYMNIMEAMLYGGEGRIYAEFSDLFWKLGVRAETSIAYVYGEDRKSGDALPQVPPLKFTGNLRIYTSEMPILKKSYIDFGVEHNLEQTRINPEANISSMAEQKTDAYTLYTLALGVKTELVADIDADFHVKFENLLDTDYRNHFSALPGMGRNIKLGFSLDY